MYSLIQLPVLSTGEGVECRVCLCQGVSSVSGRWRVEECEEEEEEGGGEGKVRRLVFTETSHIDRKRFRPGIYLTHSALIRTEGTTMLIRTP